MELNEAAAALGRRGGLKKSPRKAAASRANLERARRAKLAPSNVQAAPPPHSMAELLLVPKIDIALEAK